MKAQITVLCENSVGVPFGVVAEHGFACYIETSKGNYLFDTGQGFGIIQNATVLQKDLRKIESVMISHGHYDHAGGLPAVLKLRGPIDVYGHPQMFIDRYWSDGKVHKYIGIPYKKSLLESLGAKFRLHKEMVQVGPGVFLTGEVPRNSPFEKADANMIAHMPDGEKIHPDPVLDDLSLIVDTDKGLILILGCAHAGMINIINYAISQLQKDRIFAVIGGTHLGFSDDGQFEETLKVLDRYKIGHIGVSHCTGLAKASRLHAAMGERFFFGCVGAVLEG